MTVDALSEFEIATLTGIAAGGDESVARGYALRHKEYLERGVPLIAFNGWGYVSGFGWFYHRKIWPVVLLAMAAFAVIRAIDIFEILPINGAMSIILWLISGSVLAGLFGRQIYFKWIMTVIDRGLSRGKRGADLEEFVRRELRTIQYFRRGS